jgi:hypothetical protein
VKKLDELIMNHAHTQAGEGSSSNVALSQASSFNPFIYWICNALKEKWALMYDTTDCPYDVMTTNLTNSYNIVMCGVSIIPLMVIVKFILWLL